MKNANSGATSVLNWVLGLGMAAAITVGAFQFNKAADAMDMAKNIQAKADSLAFLKNNLQNDIRSLEDELEKSILEKEKINQDLLEKEAEIKYQKNTAYGFRNKALNELKIQKDAEIAALTGQLEDLNTLKETLDKELEKIPLLEGDVARLNEEVNSWENRYTALKQEFEEVNKRYSKLIYDAPGDNFKVEVLDKKNKLTTKAKSARTVQISFMMPAYKQSLVDGTETLYLSLFDKEVNPVPGFMEEIRMKAPDASIPIQVHATEKVDFSKNPQLVVFEVHLKENLEPGEYMGRVYGKAGYYGTAKFKLRDSLL